MSSREALTKDLDFLLFEVLAAEELCIRDRFKEHSGEGFREFLAAAFKVSEKYFLPYRSGSDQHEPTFDAGRVIVRPEIKPALDALANMGMLAASQDTEHGGLQLPWCVGQAAMALFHNSNVATATYAFLTTGALNVILAHGTDDQRRLYAQPMMSGQFLGTMDLTEPQAGSSLGDIRTSAVPAPDGSYLLKGTKMYISAGDHEISENIIHLVLARLPDAPPGTKGISLFIVPKYLINTDGTLGEHNDVAVSGLIHKMGWRGIPSTIVNFGDADHCVGYLLGPPHQGLACMFHMMNEARQVIGLTASMLGYAGYIESLEYARNRPQGRRFGNRDPKSPQVNIVEHPDVRRMLIMQKAYVEGGLALCLYGARLADEVKTAASEVEREDAELLLSVLTPIIKAWPSDYCLAANSLAIQVFGGYGYSREYPVEQLYRDNRLNPIHEGTNGIQSLDLLGRKISVANGRAFDLLIATVRATLSEVSRDSSQTITTLADKLSPLVDQIAEKTAGLRDALHTSNRGVVLSHASNYLEVIGHMVVGWLWLRQATVAEQHLERTTGDQRNFYLGKIYAARYFISHELPLVAAKLEVLTTLDPIFTDMDEAWL